MFQRAALVMDSGSVSSAERTVALGEDQFRAGLWRDLLLNRDRRCGLDGLAEELVSCHDRDGEENETGEESEKVSAKHGNRRGILGGVAGSHAAGMPEARGSLLVGLCETGMRMSSRVYCLP